MKREKTLLLLLASVMLLLFPARSLAQKYDVDYKDASVEQVIKDLRTKTGYEFVYQKQVVQDAPRITADYSNATLNQLLKRIFYTECGIDYEVVDKTVILKKAEAKKAGGGKNVVSGVVVDEKGDPLSFVTVKVKGAGNGVVTDNAGKFSISLGDVQVAVVEFSYLGFKTVERTYHPVKPMKLQRIVLHEDASLLDEVVITGYQVLDKRSLTSAVTSVKAEDIMRPDAISIDQMLEGQIPDLMTFSNSGEAGAAPKIRIRGTSSIIGNREPLWVVDGIVVSDPVQVSVEDLNDPDYVNRVGNAIAGLNPQDIERLDILKDAAATAIYGTKAANGVIVITTKRGQEGKPQIRYNTSLNYKLRPRYTDHSINVMNSKERVQFSRELMQDHYVFNSHMARIGYEGAMLDWYDGKISEAEMMTRVAAAETQNTDWFDILTHDSFSQQHTVSMNGGSDRGRYYASLGFNDNDDVVNDTRNKRYTAMLNLDTNFTSWLSASFGMSGNVTKRRYYQSSLNPVQYAYTANRSIPAYTATGDYYFYQVPVGSTESYRYSILNELDNSSIRQDGQSVKFDANFKFTLTDWLSANVIGSYTASNTDIENYWGDKTFYAAKLRKSEYGIQPDKESYMPQGGQLGMDHTRNNSYTLRLQFDWNKYFGTDDIHNFNGGLGGEMSSTKYKGYYNLTRGYYPDRGRTFVSNIDPDKYPLYTNWVISNVPTITDNLSNIVSAYLTMTYSYHRMVYVNLNGRVDGSNSFGDQSNHKFLPIWSISGSFNFSELNFMQDIKWLDYLTAKVSYGYQGNMLSSLSPVMLIRKNALSDFYGEFTANTVQNPNPNLKWEKTNSWNIGLEASFFNRRLQLEGNIYFKRTKDAFMPKTISTVNGLSTYYVNGGNIRNDGYSVAITVNPIMNKDWRWTVSTNFSREINEIKTLPAAESYELSDFLNGTAVVKGQPVGTFYSYKYLGLSPVDGGPLFEDWQDNMEELMGLSKYETFTRVLEASGCRYPDMQGGLFTTLRYKQMRLNLSFTYALGAKTRLFGMYGSGETGVGGAQIADPAEIRAEYNMRREYLDRWKKPGDEKYTNIPAIISNSNDAWYNYNGHWSSHNDEVYAFADSYWDMYDYSNLRVVSADYLKCSNIGFTYEMPSQWFHNTGISRIEMTLSASNVFTICDSKLKGQTPSQGGFTTIQLSDRPSFSFGLSVTF